MNEVRPDIEHEGHAIGFHSFDHSPNSGQLDQCREVDYRIKGYRPPQSRLTEELVNTNLLFHNFEWLASARSSLSLEEPTLRDGIVFIPILFDDFALHEGEAYEGWLEQGLDEMVEYDHAVISLHDCYGDQWLDHYPRLLATLSELGSFRTLDQVAAETTLLSAV